MDVEYYRGMHVISAALSTSDHMVSEADACMWALHP